MKKILTLILLLFILTGCTMLSDKLILDGYYEKEEHIDKEGFQDYTDYCKYFYKDDADDKFITHSNYNQVKEDDIENLISYFDNFKSVISSSNRSDEYDFEINSITKGDYYHLRSKEGNKIGESSYEKFDNYTVYLYDIETHTLIYIHNNI